MTTRLQQLENNEAILLMYLADELPAEDRAEVEQLLATDRALREGLEQIRAADESVRATLRDLDRATHPAVHHAVAIRQVTREVRRWQVERLSGREEEPLSKSGLRYPWWMYPLAAAAALFVAFVVWQGSGEGPMGDELYDSWDRSLVSDVPEASTLEDLQLAEHLEESFNNADDLLYEVEQDRPLNEAERQLLALSENAGNGPLTVWPIEYISEEDVVYP